MWEYPLFYVLLFLFGFLSLAWSLTAALLDPLLPRRLGRPLGRFMIRSGFRLYLGILRAFGILKTDLSALDRLRTEGGLVVCPNHPSLLDAVLLVSRLPDAVCIAKSKVYDNLCLGSGARMAGYIRNDSPSSLVKMAAHEVRAGQQLLIFPEGTRTERPPINALKGGFALIAKTAKAPVQTVFIESNTHFLGKGWPLFRKPEFPLVYTVRLGRRFDPPTDVRDLVEDLERHYRSEL
ncbi:lysophospholipid acyltransferase family protein [Azospirillum picis]|uniref:1-acyl-sn-glycerol-3-phosphate acyltransferase n=1 Tax=Azospirillum picis TaxID=488438 RepID=A0ABU0MQC0_9PROT|nr:lysophospholipid acyltransferase family protein [Azospirillum picis]MBP2302039.1 1-acyl-sn-glycerol-3-phosphate acyltransferase [Azospirillum picis]MDQ0535670.1 1-acyl-sn-glycerol-3-phosphate acyltransferase [Azospirillum picis]